jgi:AmmeMemoRadiSam system protein B
LKVRRPCQAGAFYAGTKNSLKVEIERCFLHRLGPGKLPSVPAKGERKIVALVCPHAGYMYSGPVAATSYYHLAIDGTPDIIIILGPNHSGFGSGVSIMTEGKWATPLGEVEIDSNVANEIVKNSKLIDVDDQAHAYEHSIEVQLPFLQYIYGDKFKFVPICMMMQDIETSVEVGEAILKALAGKNAVIIASTDMTHYEPQEIAEKKDRIAINAIIKLDEAELQRAVELNMISMCGYGPVTSALKAAKALDAREAKLLSYKTSGDVTGDYEAVVGYASIVIKKI